MTPNPYAVAGVDVDDMEKWQTYVAITDKRFLDSLVPDRGFKTWMTSLFIMAVVHDIKEAGIDCYNVDNEQQIRQIIRDRTAIGPVRQVRGRNDRGRSAGVRKAHAKRTKKPTNVKSAA